MKLKTERLIIQNLSIKDKERLLDYRNKPEVSKYQSWNTYSEKDANKLLDQVKRNPFLGQKNDKTQLGIYYHHFLIGDIHIEAVSHYVVMIGYTLDSSFWGNGYAYESVYAVLKYLREKYHYREAIAYVMKKNSKSIQLLNKLGFELYYGSFFRKVEEYILRLENLK